MGCQGCSTRNSAGEPAGCQSNGGCSSGGCNRLNTYDWLSTLEIQDVDRYQFVEVTFKQGARKNFYRISGKTLTTTGDHVVVEANNGYDIGTVTLSGELVRLQMKKKRCSEDSIQHMVIRIANERDLERLDDARALEIPAMIRARAIARTLGLDMKVGDVEYQGDRRKATFYYIADGRVDFRELIRHYAREFRVKIEMRQIGARQESARIGGLGSCGRELCCSTWLTDFKSVSTSAARYQNLAINQAKLSGQCGRLKCCLNYELDSYMEALEDFPKGADRLKTEVGLAILIKTDIFKRLMFYVHEVKGQRGKVVTLSVSRVKEIIDMNRKGEFPPDLIDLQLLADMPEVEAAPDFESVNDVIELPPEEKRRRRKKRRKKKSPTGGNKPPEGKQQGGGNNNRRSGDNKKKPANRTGQNKPQTGKNKPQGGEPKGKQESGQGKKGPQTNEGKPKGRGGNRRRGNRRPGRNNNPNNNKGGSGNNNKKD
ncbi:MAG: regulatory iron-sulfur-containing complex subunit RicT [Bacteroidota bacterium]